ncbi:uncharacterized protein LOC128887584 [Hylaeus anthracinus]|uniref:uncharacterized protein LOC128873120 n=1 Tax=Hylaeus volcanicus TaxID=313075 RepID=UPI0023B7E543|nr:uncharacterized protein LOC128873120 [Hylaeus volcanicus]XP_053999606.1 uncharacterized protein LOC128887584 [Hylaeus anthracinus]
MAEILTKFSKPRSDYSVSLLVMGPAELCHKVSEALHESAKERKWRVIVHKCESVSDITKIRFNLSIDYIIFVFDWRVQSLSEVETNICFIDKHYINCGAVCMVNCQGITKSIGMASHKSTKLRDKYNIRFLCTDISKPQSCIQLGNRILNLVGAVLGITSGIPIIGFPL